MTIDGCGGRCGMGDLGVGLVQLLGGLSAFGDLGYTEHLAYNLGDLSEGYPLGQVDIAGDDYGGGEDYVQQYDDYTPAPAPDSWDLPVANTASQEELAEIVAQRRQAIADAMKQRDIQQRKVEELDRQIVDVLNPQYQQALAAGDEVQATEIGGRIRVLNFQRAEAVQKALDWAAFQATASQMTKNARAQLELQQLYYQTMQQDPGTAQAIAQVYAEIGQATMAIKAARAAQVQQKKMEDQQYRQSLLQSQSDRVTKAQANVQVKKKALAEAKAAYERAVQQRATGTTEARLAAYKKLRDKVMVAVASMRAAQQGASQQQAILQSLMTQAQTLPAPTVASGLTPQSLPDAGLEGLDEMAPYCTVYTRDGYGPTCAQSSVINLGANLGWDERAMPLLNNGVAGVAQAFGELGSWWDVAEKLTVVGATGVATEMRAREAEQKSKAQRDLLQAACESDCRASKDNRGNSNLMSACLIRCRAGISSSSAVKALALPMPGKRGLRERPGVVLALAIVGGGVLAGLYMATRSPRTTQVQGLHGRRRRRSSRRRR